MITLAVLCGAQATAAAAGLVALRIEFRADPSAAPRVLTLRCGNRVTGTVPRPAAACARLRRLGDGAFRPTPRDNACTQVSGGPSAVRITGVYFGRPLWVTLSLVNGCEIARWQRVAFLLPRPS